jgi:hypothetical protein
MAARFIWRGIAALCVFMAGCAAETPLHFEKAPAGHVVLPGEALDSSSAYVAIVPHLLNRTGKRGSISNEVHVAVSRQGQFLAWLTTASALGAQPVSISVKLPVDRPTVIRVPPGRYYVSRVFVESDAVYYDTEEGYSLFDARPGQLNYPGDWTVETGYHEITNGARHIGWYFNATLAESSSSDLGSLGADAGVAVAQLPRAYTRQVPTTTALGER